jgi:hypothetical protein
VAVLEKFGAESPTVQSNYDLLYGEPFDEAADLPNYVADRNEAPQNPANETFLQADNRKQGPELDDDDYTPETVLRPKLPEPRTYSTHNITVGLEMFRNRALPTVSDPDPEGTVNNTYTTYQGYTVRYAYTFMSSYWLQSKTPALLSVEGSFSVYNFEHTFPDSRTADLRVVPLGFNVRYLIGLNKLFRIYPYVGFQYNIVSASDADPGYLTNIEGSRLLGGLGAQLVMSKDIDARLEAGSDGLMGGLVVKF